MVETSGKSVVPKAANYFIINENDDSKIDFVFEPKKKKLHRE